jgi:hypothetical protein
MPHLLPPSVACRPGQFQTHAATSPAAPRFPVPNLQLIPSISYTSGVYHSASATGRARQCLQLCGVHITQGSVRIRFSHLWDTGWASTQHLTWQVRRVRSAGQASWQTRGERRATGRGGTVAWAGSAAHRVRSPRPGAGLFFLGAPGPLCFRSRAGVSGSSRAASSRSRAGLLSGLLPGA